MSDVDLKLWFVLSLWGVFLIFALLEASIAKVNHLKAYVLLRLLIAQWIPVIRTFMGVEKYYVLLINTFSIQINRTVSQNMVLITGIHRISKTYKHERFL